MKPQSTFRCFFPLSSIILAGAFAFSAGSAKALDVTLTSSDTSDGTQSFTSSRGWSNSAAPSAANDYFTGAFTLRTPNSNSSYAFAGKSLTVSAGGTLSYKNDTNPGTNTLTINNLILDGGSLTLISATTLRLAGNVNVTAESRLALGGSGTDNRSITLNAPISGSSALRVTAAGTGTSALTLNGDNSNFSGGFKVGDSSTSANMANKTIVVGHANALGTGVLDMTYGTVDLKGFSTTIGGLSGVNTTGNTIKNTGTVDATLTVGNASNLSTSYAGVIADGTKKIGLTKDGAGTLTLVGTSTYTGATNVSAGTLLVTGALGGTAVTVSANGTIGGDGTIGGSLGFDSGADFAFNASQTLTVNGASVTFGNFGIANLVGLNSSVANGTYTLIDGAAIVSQTNLANLGLVNKTTIGSKFAYFEISNLNDLNVIVIPEPRAALLGGLGMLMLLRRRRV